MLTLHLANGSSISQQDTEWINMLICSPVIKMTYLMSNKRTVVFQGFEKYFFLKEEYRAFFGAKGSLLATINLFGKHQNKVYQFSLHRKGEAGQIINTWGKEFRPFEIKPQFTKKGEPKKYALDFGSPRKTNQKLWKDGYLNGIPKIEII